MEEIKSILTSEEPEDEKLYWALTSKKNEIKKQIQEYENTLNQLDVDLSNLKQGKSIMSYMDTIDVQLEDVPNMCILFIRKMVHQYEFAQEYGNSFGKLFKKIQDDKLTVLAPPMVLFHSEEFTPLGLDTEFAISVKECVTGTRDFHPGLCLKTILHGSYSNLPSVYANQQKWAEKEGYKCNSSADSMYILY